MSANVCSPRPGTLVKLTTSVYWYNEFRIDDLANLPFLLLDFNATSSSAADGMAMDQGNRLGLATLMIDGKPRGVFVSKYSMVSFSEDLSESSFEVISEAG
jgi:hypothetical protein